MVGTFFAASYGKIALELSSAVKYMIANYGYKFFHDNVQLKNY